MVGNLCAEDMFLGIGFMDSESKPVDLRQATEVFMRKLRDMPQHEKEHFFCTIAGLIWTFHTQNPEMKREPHDAVDAMNKEFSKFLRPLGWKIQGSLLKPQELSAAGAPPKEQMQ